MVEVKLIKAVEEDRYFIAEVCRETIPLYNEISLGFFEEQAEIFEKQLPEGYDIYIINHGEEKVGFLVTKKVDKDIVYIVMLYLLPKYYRKGIGSTTLKLIEESVRKDEINNIVLLADNKAHWAKSFYLKNNYNIIGESSEEVKNFKGGILAPYYIEGTILMHKEL